MSTKLAIICLVLIWYVTLRHLVMHAMVWTDVADDHNENFLRLWSWFMAIPLTAGSVMVCGLIYYALLPWVLG
jgi:hypothetical protein